MKNGDAFDVNGKSGPQQQSFSISLAVLGQEFFEFYWRVVVNFRKWPSRCGVEKFDDVDDSLGNK